MKFFYTINNSFKKSFSDNMDVKFCTVEVHGSVNLQKNALSTFFIDTIKLILIPQARISQPN